MYTLSASLRETLGGSTAVNAVVEVLVVLVVQEALVVHLDQEVCLHSEHEIPVLSCQQQSSDQHHAEVRPLVDLVAMAVG